ncbi:response regulator [Altericista sp. CCNU0014]|uniref:response regulator n=1 Tax=Altericista sp. CCNU0014 TaxID=3082949 RepID=UPI00384CAB10
MDPISLVLIEDHDVVRIGIRTALQQQPGIQVVGEAANGAQGLQVLEQKRPDVALVDVGLPGMDGIELTRRFRAFQAEQPEVKTKILILTMQGNDEVVLAAFAAGADSYCMKNIEIERLKEAVEATHQGSAWIDPAIANIVLRQLKQETPDTDFHGNRKTVAIGAVEPEYEQLLNNYPLTEREREVLECIVSGCTNIEIAEKLYITVGTVKTHVRNILEKLCANDRTEAAVRALRSGIIS